MGTLRGAEDEAWIRSITDEVTDLFGTTIILYRFSAANNAATRDPLYNEPSCANTVSYHPYSLKGFFFNYNETPFAGEGLYIETTATGHIAYDHLIAAGVVPDSFGELVSEGDVIQYHPTPNFGPIYYDIIQTTRDGFVNDEGHYTGYTIALKRSTKFTPESKNLNG
jgi:hypothetical protein